MSTTVQGAAALLGRKTQTPFLAGRYETALKRPQYKPAEAVLGRDRAYSQTVFTLVLDEAASYEAAPATFATPVANEQVEPASFPAGDGDPEGTAGSQLSQTRDDRLALLALKYEGRATVEDRARLHLLTVRLRRLDPRVTAEELGAAESEMRRLEALRDKLAGIKARITGDQ